MAKVGVAIAQLYPVSYRVYCVSTVLGSIWLAALPLFKLILLVAAASSAWVNNTVDRVVNIVGDYSGVWARS